MKIAAVFFILSVYYIASSEQRAAGPPGVHKTLEEMERDALQGMKEFKVKAGKGFSRNAKAQFTVPTDPQQLQQCANMDCPGSKES